MIEMVIRELCIAQEKIAEIHSTNYEEIHPQINQALAGLDDILASLLCVFVQMRMPSAKGRGILK